MRSQTISGTPAVVSGANHPEFVKLSSIAGGWSCLAIFRMAGTCLHHKFLHHDFHSIEVSGKAQNLASNLVFIGGHGSQLNCGPGSGDFGKAVTFTRSLKLMSQ